MQILFGAENDGLHISPTDPNGYEWWYFDAISDDERYILVVIYFLGTPMSPYYKAVTDGKNPLPKDWCGVFMSLHERTTSGYRERAYAYNVYRGGDFAEDGASVSVGGSRFVRGMDGAWNLSFNERCLWLGCVRGELCFAPDFSPRHGVLPGDEAHTWVCVAPDCRVSGDLQLANGETVRFTGRGYHDHNYGRLPWAKTKRWVWGRGRTCDETGQAETVVYYITQGMDGKLSPLCLVFDGATNRSLQLDKKCVPSEYCTNYGLGLQGCLHFTLHPPNENLIALTTWEQNSDNRLCVLSNAPFYVRHVSAFHNLLDASNNERRSKGIGISEVFEPARLCGSVISRMMWTRIRRRS